MKTATINLHDATLINAFKYPAGEWQVRLTDEGLKLLDGVTRVTLIARINNADDVIQLNLLCDALLSVIPDDNDDLPIDVVVPYFPASRADRRFTPGDCHGLNIYLELISNAYGVRYVSTLDLHNFDGMAPRFQTYVKNVSAEPFIRQAIHDFASEHKADRIVVLFPDEGACKRYKIGNHVGSNGGGVNVSYFYASKKRDAVTGKLLGFDVPQLPDLPVLIVDDLCDGGGTFNGIAEIVVDRMVDNHHVRALGLYVTHGIFSKGLEDLKVWFNNIYTTSSHTNAVMYSATNEVVAYNCMPDLKDALKRN